MFTSLPYLKCHVKVEMSIFNICLLLRDFLDVIYIF